MAAVSLCCGVAACGTHGGGQPAGSSTATAMPSGPATLTTADNGAPVRLRRGQQVRVELGSQGLFSWHIPAVTGAAVTMVSSDGGYPGRLAARAAFLAVQPGSATLTALDDTACLHAQPACEPAQHTWQVTVIVTSG
jgi:hypothetical protein